MLVGVLVGRVDQQHALGNFNRLPIFAVRPQVLGHLQKEVEQARTVMFAFDRDLFIVETCQQFTLPQCQARVEEVTVGEVKLIFEVEQLVQISPEGKVGVKLYMVTVGEQEIRADQLAYSRQCRPQRMARLGIG